MGLAIRNKKDLLDLAGDFDGFVKKNDWVSSYDTEADSFSAISPNLSKDARLRYFNDEIAFYVTGDNRFQGIFIEYFKSNFVKHQRKREELNKVVDDISKRRLRDRGLVTVDQSKLQVIAPSLEETLKDSLADKLDLDK